MSNSTSERERRRRTRWRGWRGLAACAVLVAVAGGLVAAAGRAAADPLQPSPGGLTPGGGDEPVGGTADGPAPRYAAIAVQSFIVAGRSLDGTACGQPSADGRFPADGVTAATGQGPISEGEPATFCYLVSNLGTTRLDRVRLSDPALGLVDAAVPTVGGQTAIEPDGFVVLFHHGEAAPRTIADATVVTARPVDGAGAPLSGLAEPSAESAPGPVVAAPTPVAPAEPTAPADTTVEPPPPPAATASDDEPSAAGRAAGPAAASLPEVLPGTVRATDSMAEAEAAATGGSTSAPQEAAAAGDPSIGPEVAGVSVEAAVGVAAAGDEGANGAVGGELALTGPGTESWVLAVMGSALVFFGYTCFAAARRPRRATVLAGHAQLDALGFERTRDCSPVRPSAGRRPAGIRAR